MEEAFKSSDKNDAMQSRFLLFSVENEIFGVGIDHVMEIVGVQPVTQVPELPGYVLGVINLRGKIIPVLDARLRLKKAKKEYDDRTCIIVMEYADMLFGLIVDRVVEVLKIAEKNISATPSLSKNSRQGFMKGIGKVNEKVVLLLDCEKLLLSEESKAFSA